MDEKLTNLAHLKALAQESTGLIGEVASETAAALDEMREKKLDAADAITMDKVQEAINAAIKAAILDSWKGSY